MNENLLEGLTEVFAVYLLKKFMDDYYKNR